ncbi:hypothetical protein EDB85DRAFT_163358 [Lactarius pseudohatsudake]|nr:hypothetical protein EDB85DRAFT_163358 [Lactarius pseudohatsudake]
MDESDRRAIHKLWSNKPSPSRKRETPRHSSHARLSLGRYNPKVSPVEDVNLPAALFSRFDLLFLLLDKDEQLAQHVTRVHMYSGHLEFEYEPLEPALMRAYIPLARRCRPVAPPDVSSTSSTLTCACGSSPKTTYSATARTPTRLRAHASRSSAARAGTRAAALRRGGAARGRGRGTATDGGEQGEPARRRWGRRRRA